jgi:hypothetical protein
VSNPTVNITPSIIATIGAAAAIGALQKTINWPAQQPLFQFTPGTGAGQMDTWYDGTRTLASNTNESLDLTGTALLDPFGVAIAFGHINLIAIRASAANTTDLTVGNGTNPFVGPFGAGTHTLILKPGDLAMFVRPTTGYVVTNSTADILKVVNATGAAASYDLLLGGVSV